MKNSYATVSNSQSFAAWGFKILSAHSLYLQVLIRDDRTLNDHIPEHIASRVAMPIQMPRHLIELPRSEKKLRFKIDSHHSSKEETNGFHWDNVIEARETIKPCELFSNNQDVCTYTDLC